MSTDSQQTPVTVLSVGTIVMGNSVYHRNMVESLAEADSVRIVPRTVLDYWGLTARLMFHTVGSPRIWRKSYRLRAEWLMSEVTRRGIARDMKRQRIDVVHCHTQAHALRCGRIAERKPLVVSMDCTAELLRPMANYAGESAAISSIANLERQLFSKCAIVGGVTTWVTDSLQSHYTVENARVRLCRPCVDTSLFTPPPTRESVEGRRLRVVFIGNDFQRKGGEMLTEVVTQHFAGLYELDVVSGQAPPDSVPTGIRWHTNIQPGSRAMIEMLQNADVFAMPTSEECFGMVYMEAMACGLPLIGTNVMGVPDLVVDGVNGISVPVGDTESLRVALESLRSDEMRARLGTAGRSMAGGQFSFEASRRQWETIFLSAANSRGVPASAPTTNTAAANA